MGTLLTGVAGVSLVGLCACPGVAFLWGVGIGKDMGGDQIMMEYSLFGLEGLEGQVKKEEGPAQIEKVQGSYMQSMETTTDEDRAGGRRLPKTSTSTIACALEHEMMQRARAGEGKSNVAESESKKSPTLAYTLTRGRKETVRVTEAAPRRPTVPTAVLEAAIEASETCEKRSDAIGMESCKGEGAAACQGNGKENRNGGSSLENERFVLNSAAGKLMVGKGPLPGTVLLEDADGSGQAVVDPKRAKRIIANRQSAARSKERRMRYIADLESRCQSLQEETNELNANATEMEAHITALEAENGRLKECVNVLEGQAKVRSAVADALQKEVEQLRRANTLIMQAVNDKDAIMNRECTSVVDPTIFADDHAAAHRSASLTLALGKALSQSVPSIPSMALDSSLDELLDSIPYQTELEPSPGRLKRKNTT